MEKDHIKIFITRTNKFRSIITEYGQRPYEITVGGREWEERFSAKYKSIILSKCAHRLLQLQSELLKITTLNSKEME